MDPRLSPTPSRLAEISEVYRTLGLDPTAPMPVGVTPFVGAPVPTIIVTPLLSNNSQFE